MIYRREIDGLRALAVVPVILFHAGLSTFSGGFVGVDVFFVISGYLITSILLADLERGDFSIARFYERRARRILPALFLVMACCIPFAWAWMLPDEWHDFSQSLVAVVLFVSNILFWREEGYFAPVAELKPLLHTWSLAVEEQYYLLFPLFLLVAWRLGPRRVLLMIVGIALLSLAASEWASRIAAGANFYLAPTRAWELLAGSICAFALRGRAPGANDWLGLSGIVLILLAIFAFDEKTPFPGLYALVPVVGTALIVLFGGPGSRTARLLGLRPLVGIGLVSYSAYLWHQPLFAFARLQGLGEPPMVLMLALAVLAMGLAWLSWRFVERPFRAGKASLLPTRRGVFAASLGGGALLIAAGAAGSQISPSRGIPAFVDRAELTLVSRDNGYCFHSVHDRLDLKVGADGLNCFLSRGPGPKLLLFGDSLAAHWEPFLKPFGARNGLEIRAVTTNWCHPTLGADYNSAKTSRAWAQCRINRAYLAENAGRFDAIVLSGNWSFVSPASVAPLIDRILAPSQARIVVMPSPHQFARRSLLRVTFGRSKALVVDDIAETGARRFDAAMRARYRNEPRVMLLSPADLFFDNFGSKGALDRQGFPYSLDGNHISVRGAKQAFAQFADEGGEEKLLGFVRREGSPAPR